MNSTQVKCDRFEALASIGGGVLGFSGVSASRAILHTSGFNHTISKRNAKFRVISVLETDNE